MNKVDITIATGNKSVKIVAPTKDSLHASLLADRLNKLLYLKVYERKYIDGMATVWAYTIRNIFRIETLHEDLDTMEDLITNNSSHENSSGNQPTKETQI